MGMVTPILDSLRPQVLGRAIDLSSASQRFVNAPLSSVAAIRGASGEQAGRRPDAARGMTDDTPVTQTRHSAATSRARTFETFASPRSDDGRAAAGPDVSALSISRAGRFLARALSGDTLSSAVNASRARPLIANAQTVNTTALAGLLEHHVATSGVFYEAHLLQWLRGRRSMQQMAREPQARLPAGLLRSAGGMGAATGGDSNKHADSGQAGQAHLGQLARQQIDALHTGVFRWQGFAAPDVPLRWEIREHRDEGLPDRQTADVQCFHSTGIRLELPRLGVLEVRLTLRGEHIDIQAWSEQATSRDRLGEARERLRERLGARGFAAIDIDLLAEEPS